MATVVNTTPATTDSGSGTGFLLGILLIIVMAILFFVYGLPALTNSVSQSQPQVNVPGKIDVNVNNPGQ
jgi:hypothetical protein